MSAQCEYVLVSDEEYGEAVELPLEDNGTLLLSTLTAQFPGASGLKFRTENNVVRGVRLADGRFHVPDNEWGKTPYYCVFPKGNFISFYRGIQRHKYRHRLYIVHMFYYTAL